MSNKVLSRLTWIMLLAVIAAPGCATRYSITEKEVQAEIDRKMPLSVTQNLEIAFTTAVITLDTLIVSLPEQAGERVQLMGTGTLAARYGGFTVAQPLSADVAGHLRYNREEKLIYISDAEVTSLEAPSLAKLLPAELYGTLISKGRQAFVAAINDKPLYTLTDRSFSESMFRKRGSSIEARDKKIIFHLD